MKDFITKMMCLFLLLMIGTWSVKAQTPMQAEHITANDSYMQGVDANEASYAPVKRLGREPIYDNGPMVTHPGAGPGGTDYSALHAGENILATGFYQPSGLTLADDFTLEESVSITEMEFYGIQQGSTTSSIFTGVYVEIYDGPPNEGGTKIFGDMTTNRIISSEFSGIYRTTSDLSSTVIPIMRVVADVQIDLPAGTYWVSVATTGQALSIPYTYGNPCSSPEGIVVGNGLNYSSSGWIPWIDSDGTGTRYALPFKIHGTVASGGEEPMYDTYAPPTNVTASATGNNVKVSWKAPEGVQPPTYAGWLTRSSGVYNTAIGYTGGFNTGQVIECYARFTPDELMDYEITNRNKISQFSWYGANGEITAGVAYKVKIYQGGSVIGATVNPGTLVYEQDIPAITAGAWNDIALTTPVSIDVSKELWFGISITITSSGYAFIMTLDNAGDADYTKNLVNMDGGWSRLYDLASSFAPYNWMTRAYIVDANGKGIALGNNEEKNSKAITYYYLDQYEVYCNDALVGITTGTNFVHQNAMLKDGALNYCVKSVFNDGGKSEAACAPSLTGNGEPVSPDCLGDELLFFETFETNSPTVGGWVNQIVSGTTIWGIYAYNGGSSLQPATTPSGATGRKAATRGSSRGHTVKYISPAINMGTNPGVLNFWHTQRNWVGDQDQLKVYYAHSASGPWTQIAQYTTEIYDWTEETIILPNPSSTYYIAFEAIIGYGYGVQLDDVKVIGGEPDPSIKPVTPANLTASTGGLSWYNVNLTWEMLTTIGVAGYYVYRDGFLLNDAPVDRNAMSYIDVVPAGGTYLYEVQAISNLGCLSDKVSVTVQMLPDPCDGFKVTNYPYTQGFENTQNILELCWKQEILKGTVAWEIVPALVGNPATTHSGSQKIRYFYASQLEQVSRLISPMFDLSEGGAQLSFWYTNREWFLGQDVLRIYYKNKANAEWTLIETFNDNVEVWTQVTIDLPDNTDTYWIAFEANTAQGYGVQLDDIKVTGCAVQKDLPYIEGFELGADAINCWVQEPDSPSALWSVTNSSGTPNGAHSGTYKLFYQSYSGEKNTIRSPRFNLSRQSYDYLKFSFWHSQQEWLGDQDYLKFFYRTDEESEWTQLAEWKNSISGWKQEGFVFTDVSSSFRFAFEATGNFGYGIHIDDIEMMPCNNLTLPFAETFDTEIPPCWDNISEGNTPWKYVTTGTSPTCAPHSSGGMLQYNAYSYSSGSKGQLYTAPVQIPMGEQYIEISFWMYRDNGYTSSTNERVNLYVSPTRSIDGLSPILSIPRVMSLAPAVSTAGWYQYSACVDATTLGTRRIHIVLEGVSQFGNNIYVDDISANFYYCDDNPVTLPIVNSFEGDFPEMCWDLAATDNTIKWTQTSGSAQDGNYFIYADCFSSYAGTHTELTTPPFLTEGKNQLVSFWIYRFYSMWSTGDRLNVYLTEDGNITSATPVITIYRALTQNPVVAREGWYQYYAELPCAGMTTAKVTFQAISDFGDDIMIDNIAIGDLCIPVRNTVSLGSAGIPLFWTEGHITWDEPQMITGSFTGYNVYRNGTKIASNISATEYFDDMSNLGAGEYEYCVTAVYNNNCGESESICGPDPIIKVVPCANVPSPRDLSADKHVDEWYDLDLKWKNPIGESFGYVNETNDAIGLGNYGPLSAAVRFSTEDLLPFNGKSLTKIDFVPGSPNMNYVFRIWDGDGSLTPGTLLHTQTVNANNFQIGTYPDYIWNSVVLSTPITINASKELWIEIYYENYSVNPAGAYDTNSPIKYQYSDLVTFEGFPWGSITDAGLTTNWCIVPFVRFESGNDEIKGYNVYRDGALITNPMLSGITEKYRDRTPGPGTYLYEVEAIYHTYCLSDRASLEVEMEQSPCETLWAVPIMESFDDFDRFPPWCWELDGSYPWRQVASGSNPSVQPHSGGGMLMYYNYSYSSGSTGTLISPKFATTDHDYMLKFWMYRDNNGYYGGPDYADLVNVYVSATPSITGLSPVYTVHRNMSLSPAVTEEGWHQFAVQIPTTGMTGGAYVIFEGVSRWGNNTFVDDIVIVDELACDPVYDVVVEQPREGEVLISWSAPINAGLTGYRVFRDGILIHNNITETYMSDYVSLGNHEYCIIALFDKAECTESLPVCVTISVVPQCDPVKSVTAEVIGERTVQITWTPTAASGISSYSLYRNGSFVTDTEETIYRDENVEPGSYKYGVVVNYNAKPCLISDVVESNSATVESCVSIENLTYTVVNNSVTLNWDFTGKTAGNRDAILSEGFENGIPSNWINLDLDEDGNTWATEAMGSYEPYTYPGHSGNHAAGSESWSDYYLMPYTPDNWLITPMLILGKESVLTFWVGAYLSGWYAEHYGVFISTTGTDPSDFTLLFEETLSSTNYKQITIDLAAYKGNVYIAFRHYNSTDVFSMMIDDIEVTTVGGPMTYDVYKDGAFVANVDDTFYEEADLAPGIYEYCIRPVYEQCTVELACVEVEIDDCQLGDVTNVVAEQGVGYAQRVDLRWSYSGEPADFQIWKNNELLTTVSDMSYSDSDVEFYKSYNYCVVAVAEGCTSGATGCASVKLEFVGIEDLSAAVNVYPNPASTYVTIDGGNIVEVEIYNAVGQLIDQIMVVEGETVKNINVAGYESGAYIFRLRSADQTVINKSIMIAR